MDAFECSISGGKFGTEGSRFFFSPEDRLSIEDFRCSVAEDRSAIKVVGALFLALGTGGCFSLITSPDPI
jgi:hypothetical protein